MKKEFKKYKVKLKNPLDGNIESGLYTDGVLAYGEWGEEEIVVKTFKTKEQLVKTEKDVKDVTEELIFTPEEMNHIKLLQHEFKAEDEQEFLQYYFWSN